MPFLNFGGTLIVSLGNRALGSWCMNTPSGWQDSKCDLRMFSQADWERVMRIE